MLLTLEMVVLCTHAVDIGTQTPDGSATALGEGPTIRIFKTESQRLILKDTLHQKGMDIPEEARNTVDLFSLSPFYDCKGTVFQSFSSLLIRRHLINLRRVQRSHSSHDVRFQFPPTIFLIVL